VRDYAHPGASTTTICFTRTWNGARPVEGFAVYAAGGLGSQAFRQADPQFVPADRR
jgi:hypothetical protein